MKILIRVFGLSIIGIIFIMMAMTMTSLNTRLHELNTISSIAMTQTQMIMTEQIEDKLYNTSNAREYFDNNDDYLNYFIESLKPLIASDSDYSVDILNIDYEKGLLDVRINCTYTMLNGEEKTLSTRKTSIVDILIKDNEGS